MPDEEVIPSIQSSQRYRVPGITTKNLSIVVTGIVLIVALLKARKQDVPKIVETIFSSHLFCALGWALTFVILLASVVFVKLLIRQHDKEIGRLSNERDELQTRLLER
jgi:chromate transport protein ChrA